MNNEQILAAARERAANNGYKDPGTWVPEECGAESIIFSHNFAKALWGEAKKGVWDTNGDGTETLKGSNAGYKYHLQQMVISEAPLQYLKQFLK
jgi:hypothetical protein